MNSNPSEHPLIKLQKEMYELVHRDPKAAIKVAIELTPDEELSVEDIDGLKAGIFIDAGGEIGDSAVIKAGIDILQETAKKQPNRADVAYNLANGLSSLAQVSRMQDQPWFLATSDIRREARNLYEKAGSNDIPFDLRSQSKTNQANLLVQAYRWIEAFDAYKDALHYDPKNGVASSGIAKILLHCANRFKYLSSPYQKLAAKYARIAKESINRAGKYAGPSAIKTIKKLTVPNEESVQEIDLSQLDDYTSFVANQNLALSPIIEGLQIPIKRWDSLSIRATTR